MKLNTEQLAEIKSELKKFSSAPILKSYKLIAQVYKSDIEPQALIDSEITKCFVRIGQKKYKEDDEEKYAKAIKICRKLVKQWKQIILSNGETPQEDEKQIIKKVHQKPQQQKNIEPPIQKKSKPNDQKKEKKETLQKNGTNPIPKETNNDNQNGNHELVQDDKRNRAIEGLKKYFSQRTNDEQIEWAKKIEQVIYELYQQSVQIYMDKVKCMVKMIDRNDSYRSKLLNGEFNLVEEIKKLK